MITAVDLFGRSAITSAERKRLKAANKTALDIYKQRNDYPYSAIFPEDVTLAEVEQHVIGASSMVKNVYDNI